MLNSGLLEMGHARALLGLSGEQQIEMAESVISKKLSVKETEKLIQRINIPSQESIFFIPPDFEKKVIEWKKCLSKKISSNVNLHLNSDEKGRVVIHFESLEEADWLMNNIKFGET